MARSERCRGGRSPRALREDVEAALEPRQQGLRGEQPDAVGRQLDRERQAVEPRADRVDDLAVVLPARARGPGAGREQGDGVRRRERLHRVGVLAGHPQGGAARRQHGQARDGGEQPGDLAGVVEEALEAVEHEQRRLAVVEPLGELLGGRGHHPEGGGRLGGEQARVLDAVEVDVHGAAPVAIGHAAGDLEREPRLPHPAGADERDQAHARPGEDVSAISASSPSRPISSSAGAGSAAGDARRRLLGRQLGVVREDRLLEPPQLRPGLDPELVDEQPAPLAHHLERLRLAAAAVEREHQVRRASARAAGARPPASAARRPGRRRGRARAARPSAPRSPPSAAPRAARSRAGRTRRTGGRRAPARATARARPPGRPTRTSGSSARARSSRSSKRRESIALALDAERVAGRAAVDGRGLAEPLAQARDLLLEGLHAVARRPAGPHRLDQLVDRDRLRRAQRERREQGALLGAVELDGAALDADVERAEQPDLDVRAHPVSER